MESRYPKFWSCKPCDFLSCLSPIYKSLPSFPQPPTPASPPWPASEHSRRWNQRAAVVTLQFVCHIVTGFPHPPHSVVKAHEEEEGQIMKYRKAGKEEAAERQQPNWNAKNYGEVTEREAQTRNYTWWLSRKKIIKTNKKYIGLAFSASAATFWITIPLWLSPTWPVFPFPPTLRQLPNCAALCAAALHQTWTTHHPPPYLHIKR